VTEKTDIEICRRRLELVSVMLVALVLVALAVTYSLLAPDFIPSATGDSPDATIFISTLIVLYTVFLTVYGAVLPQLTDRKKGRDRWIWLMVGVTLGAVAFDLYRVENSLGDLYAATNHTFTSAKFDDAGYEFVHYWFLGNVLVIVILLITLAWPRRPIDTGTDPGPHQPRKPET
jgi:hypothetical protein